MLDHTLAVKMIEYFRRSRLKDKKCNNVNIEAEFIIDLYNWLVKIIFHLFIHNLALIIFMTNLWANFMHTIFPKIEVFQSKFTQRRKLAI